jgi:hypothetical protein
MVGTFSPISVIYIMKNIRVILMVLNSLFNNISSISWLNSLFNNISAISWLNSLVEIRHNMFYGE